VVASIAVRRAALNLQIQRRSVRELALLNEVSRAIIRSELDAEALCELIYSEASKIVDTSSFHLGLFNGSNYTLQVRVQDRVRLPKLTVNLEARDGIVGWMRDTGRALLVEDFTEEMDRLPARPRYQSAHPPRAGIYVPLIAGDQVIGSISVQSYRPNAFDADDLRLLSLIADQAAVAIARARAFAEAHQRAVQLQAIHAVSERITAILNLDELLPSIVHLINEHFGYQPVHIFTVDEARGSVVFRASTAQDTALQRLRALRLGLGEGIVGAAAQSRSPIVVDDVQADPRYMADGTQTRSELAVPLRVGDQVIGVLDVQSDEVSDFEADDLFVMRTLADQIAIAIDSANSYTAQQEEAWTLNTLLQIAENIGSASSLDELLPMIVRLPPLLVGCQRCYCLLWDRERAAFTPVAAYGITREQRAAFLGQPLAVESTPLLARLTGEEGLPSGPTVVRRAQEHGAECREIIERFGSGTLVVLPLTTRASLIGTLLLDYNSPDEQFNERTQALYSGTASQIAGALENALLALEAAEAARLEQELRVAQEIQGALLPRTTPVIAGWQIAGGGRPARLVGGDFYDFWRLAARQKAPESDQGSAIEEQRLDAEREPHNPQPATRNPQPSLLGFVVADVSDKGVPAAMFMALSRSLVRAAALDGSQPSLALERANRWISRDSETGMFVTLFYGVLDPRSGTLSYSCAGHNPPLLYRAAQGSFTTLQTPGIAMGVIEEIVLGQAQVLLEPGDTLVCYTDGATEAIDAGEEQFGVDRLKQVIAHHHAEGAGAVMQAIFEAVDDYTSGQPPFDDITLVVIRREEGAAP
jgi:serine phosphatase RsbU (regulator of sigma subunit)/putative methionine-R-sulfoxide reductase with GAF domain